MTDQRKKRKQPPRITLGPLAIEFFGENRNAAALEALILEVQNKRDDSDSPTSLDEDLTDILDGQADLSDQQTTLIKNQEATIQSQLAAIDTLQKFAALTDERSQHLLEEMRYTRAMMGSFLTEGDKRNLVLERLEKSCDRREAMSLELARKLGVDLKKRRREMDKIKSGEMTPVIPNGDIEQHHNDVRRPEIGGRER